MFYDAGYHELSRAQVGCCFFGSAFVVTGFIHGLLSLFLEFHEVGQDVVIVIIGEEQFRTVPVVRAFALALVEFESLGGTGAAENGLHLFAVFFRKDIENLVAELLLFSVIFLEGDDVVEADDEGVC